MPRDGAAVPVDDGSRVPLLRLAGGAWDCAGCTAADGEEDGTDAAGSGLGAACAAEVVVGVAVDEEDSRRFPAVSAVVNKAAGRPSRDTPASTASCDDDDERTRPTARWACNLRGGLAIQIGLQRIGTTLAGQVSKLMMDNAHPHPAHLEQCKDSVDMVLIRSKMQSSPAILVLSIDDGTALHTASEMQPMGRTFAHLEQRAHALSVTLECCLVQGS
jgi:hypothetical protein